MTARRALLFAALAGMALACEGPAGQDGTNGTNGNNGTDGTACTVTDNEDGTFNVSCTDGTNVTIENGSDGVDGTDCTVVDNGNGTKTITCTDGTSVTVTDGSDGLDGSDCTVTDNADGSKTITCEDGTSVTVTDGEDGETGGNVEILNFHSTGTLLATEYEEAGKFYANAEITSATADAAGVVTVNFAVTNADGDPVTNVASVSANISKLVTEGSSNKWVPYIWRTQTVSAAGEWPAPAGTTGIQGSSESSATGSIKGTLTNNGDGTYTYVFGNNISALTMGTGGPVIAYERNLTHRVSIMMGGYSGPTASPHFDFVPDGSVAPSTRAIVVTETCKSCHGQEFHGHGGNRVTVENCATCHVPEAIDPHSGEDLDLKVMIHKIHAGGELATIPGTDGKVWDDPATVADESADNGEYAIWGYNNNKFDWWEVGFPAMIANCTKCHAGTTGDALNWRTKPSRAACGSCHDDIDWTAGTNHLGGAQTNDSGCTLCHPATGTGIGGSVTVAHDWTVKDTRNVPEYDVAISVSTPANGTHFVAGESPVVTMVISEDGAVIDHTTVVEDTNTDSGCTTASCPEGDGNFRVADFFVHGPRANRNPVLTTNARAKILSSNTGPWDLSASGANLVLKVDGGQNIVAWDVSGGDSVVSGTITVPVVASFFTSGGTAAATPAEVVAWLNANASFNKRATAYLEGGKVAIRSRNLGSVYSVQLQTSVVATNVFGGDTAVKTVGGYYPSNVISQRTAAGAVNDPKVAWTTGSITYTLDPVDDLQPGTYIAFVKFGDIGRVDGANYRTPSVAKVTFQVKQAAEELAPAGNCNSCHQNADGKGFVLDFSRHNKIFSDTAVDQCGACHDYQPQSGTGLAFTGGHPISKRVHAVHFGSSLNYPLQTVAYSNGDPVKGRNWFITLPQDVRNCEVCHTATGSSGSWMVKAARLPCWGCHDADAAKAHFSLQTFDPTPADAWSGDEQESCQTCH